MIRGYEARALDLCARLDRELAAAPEGDDHDRLHAIGELLGGLSVGGFWWDCLAHLRRAEEAARDDEPPGMQTEAGAEYAREEAARDFLDAAECLLNERVQVAA